MTFDFNEQYINEWRSLKFYYEFSHDQNCWIFTGSRQGLLNFCKLLEEYCLNPVHNGISEHEHYGPDSYLKVITWDTPSIRESGIYGSLKDLKRLGDFMKEVLLSSKKNEIIIDNEYSEGNECYILLRIMEDSFDPATPFKKREGII